MFVVVLCLQDNLVPHSERDSACHWKGDSSQDESYTCDNLPMQWVRSQGGYGLFRGSYAISRNTLFPTQVQSPATNSPAAAPCAQR